MRIAKVGLAVALAGAALGAGVMGTNAGLGARIARLGAPDGPDAPPAPAAATPAADERADSAARRAATPTLGFKGMIASLEGAVARELDAFCERAGVAPEKKQAIAVVLTEHRKHGLSFVGHPRGDFLMDRLNQFTRSRVLGMLDPEQARQFDRSELPGALGE
ncbi:hypothetical protein [Sorangium sp. So ce131]|uniref:hypothetical protein n=1 Tax=Sorangium sp. So ce131 TaxID=3133282 RepID=UPI003F647FB1